MAPHQQQQQTQQQQARPGAASAGTGGTAASPASGNSSFNPAKVDAKVYLANERTLLTWMRQAVLLGGLGAASCGLASYHHLRGSGGGGGGGGGSEVSRVSPQQLLSRLGGMALLLLGAGVAAAACRNYFLRVEMIRCGVGSDSARWDSKVLPRLLTGCLAAVMAAVFVGSLQAAMSR